MQVKDIMRRAPMTVAPDDLVERVAERMASVGIHHVPVARDGKLVGLISDRDLAVHRARHGQSGMRGSAAEVMRFPPPTISPEEDLAAVAARMLAEEVDCYPVVDGGELVGIVTTTDLLLACVEEAEALPVAPPRPLCVADAMTPNPLTVHVDDDLLDAAAKMSAHDLRHVPVIDRDRHLVGLLTERDVRAAARDLGPAPGAGSPGMAPRRRRVSSAMLCAPVTTGPERPLREVARDFANQDVLAVPVVDPEGHVLGILSYVDLLQSLSRPE